MSGIIGGIKGAMKKKIVAVPTNSDANWSGVSLLLTGDDLLDHSSSVKSLSVSGATVNTSVKKYGTGSLYFNGSSQYISGTTGFALGAGDFTVDMWVYKTTTMSTWHCMCTNRDSGGSNGLWMGFAANSNAPIAYTVSGQIATSSTSISLNTWTHIAYCRSGSTLTIYVDGVATATASTSSSFTNASGSVGYDLAYNSFSFAGYIDDLRITPGVARYTANFTPPTAAYPIPVTGTQVYAAALHQANGPALFSSGFAPDLVISGSRDGGSYQQFWYDRTRGIGNPPTGAALPYLTSTSTNAETSTGPYFYIGTNGFGVNVGWSTQDVIWMFKRAAGFFDIVTWKGTGSTKTVAHALGATPELIIVKHRQTYPTINLNFNWNVYYGVPSKWLSLNATDAAQTDTGGNARFGALATSSTFTVGNVSETNSAGGMDYMGYLFASSPGVSKVGTFTGNGSSQTINCSFTSSARFIMIKRIDAAGDWYVWDTTRGITSGGNDPHISLNTASSEVTTDNSVDANSAGFAVNQTSATNINVNGGSYLFLAIA